MAAALLPSASCLTCSSSPARHGSGLELHAELVQLPGIDEHIGMSRCRVQMRAAKCEQAAKHCGRRKRASRATARSGGRRRDDLREPLNMILLRRRCILDVLPPPTAGPARHRPPRSRRSLGASGFRPAGAVPSSAAQDSGDPHTVDRERLSGNVVILVATSAIRVATGGACPRMQRGSVLQVVLLLFRRHVFHGNEGRG